MRDLLSVPAMRPPGSPRCGVPGRLHIRAAGERPPRARPQRRGSPGPIPNPAVKPAFAESTAAQGCGRAGRRARGGRFSFCARSRARGDARNAPHAPKARRGIVPLRAFSRSGPMAIRAASACGPWLRPGGVAQRRAGGRSPRCRVWHREARRAASAQTDGPRVHARDTLCGPLKGSGGRRYIALRC